MDIPSQMPIQLRPARTAIIRQYLPGATVDLLRIFSEASAPMSIAQTTIARKTPRKLSSVREDYRRLLAIRAIADCQRSTSKAKGNDHSRVKLHCITQHGREILEKIGSANKDTRAMRFAAITITGEVQLMQDPSRHDTMGKAATEQRISPYQGSFDHVCKSLQRDYGTLLKPRQVATALGYRVQHQLHKDMESKRIELNVLRSSGGIWYATYDSVAKAILDIPVRRKSSYRS
jgi:hypothetical protein